jgi:hypothetical protein
MHKHYNNLQRILKQNLFTKVIKNAEQQGLGSEVLDLVIKGVERNS